ncbi:MAG: hypothetical protein EXX96DRAFT_604173 [Benjaminiella poitrasii]|nr:MAG: hypothetical protein EXX96DRAFT_604173 [Benjaminiella poitrasii]
MAVWSLTMNLDVILSPICIFCIIKTDITSCLTDIIYWIICISWCESVDIFHALWRNMPTWCRYCHREGHTKFECLKSKASIICYDCNEKPISVTKSSKTPTNNSFKTPSDSLNSNISFVQSADFPESDPEDISYKDDSISDDDASMQTASDSETEKIDDTEKINVELQDLRQEYYK